MVERVKRLPLWGVYALLAYMPFHILLSQSLSLLTGGLSAWKIGKDVITALLVALVVILVWTQQKSTPLFNRFVILAVVYGLLHLAIWALNPHIFRDSALLGTVYNNRLLWYLLIGMGAGLLFPKELHYRRLMKLAIMVSTIVCLLGVLQYLLPKDLLTHVGYSVARGVKPAFFIDDKPDLPRIMSTLRDPNSLGAFLILPITILVYQFFKNVRRRTLITGLLLLHGLALFLTFSRSAWLGTAISVGVLLIQQYRARLKPLFLKYWPLLIGTVLLVGGLTLSLRDQYLVQNVISHSDENTQQADSNELHAQFIEKGIKGIADKPLGHGPGTAGLVSIQNKGSTVLTENYYVQLGYEVGVIGLALFVVIQIMVYLYLLRLNNVLALCLLASFWGYFLMNMLLHTWSNEAVAVQWWLLAGTVLVTAIQKKTHLI